MFNYSLILFQMHTVYRMRDRMELIFHLAFEATMFMGRCGQQLWEEQLLCEQEPVNGVDHNTMMADSGITVGHLAQYER